jgi:antirestriction protein ArdC
MGEKDKTAFDPKAAAEARKAELEEITGKLEKGVKDIFTTEGYKNYLNFCAKLPRYSVNNQILIMMQRPDATMCQSYTGWKEANRFVKKGEKGIRILAPAPYKMEREQDKMDASGRPVLDRDGEPVKEKVEITVNAFKPVSTFDVSQTEGEPIPQIGATELTNGVDGYASLMDAIKQVVPVPISFEQIDSGAKGYFHLEENRIVVQEGMSEAQTVKTLLHEASHQALHSREAMEHSGDKKSRGQKEVEAESVAYVVCQHFGIDTSDYSFPYVATWSEGKEVPELKASLDVIRRTAADLIVKIEDKVMGKEKEQFEEIEKFAREHADELPFGDPGASQNAGFIKIEPPVDFSEYKSDRKLTITAEGTKEEPKKQEGEPAKETPKQKESAKKEPSKNKAAEKTDSKEKAKPAKSSVKEKLKTEKAKAKKTKGAKKAPAKDLQEAI